ncbi:hypothetical protein ACA910_002518 [Epithemia clementina (nom. ined.)]
MGLRLLRLWQQQLQEQHARDLSLYRSAHQHALNRYLHWILIPVEVASTFLLVKLVLLWLFWRWWFWLSFSNQPRVLCRGSLNLWVVLVDAAGFTFGLVSWILAVTQQVVVDHDDDHHGNNTNNEMFTSCCQMSSSLLDLSLGLTIFLFHLIILQGSNVILSKCENKMAKKLRLEQGNHHHKKEPNGTKFPQEEEEEHKDNIVKNTTMNQSLHRKSPAWRSVLLPWLGAAFGTWSLAWFLQVVVGHALLESNQPNLTAHPQDVSLLSAATSILLAWKS